MNADGKHRGGDAGQGAGRASGSGHADRAAHRSRTLDSARKGERLVVHDIKDDHARMHAIRFGMSKGAEITCLTRVPGGPVVLKCGRTEIAVGRKLAECILVRGCRDCAGVEEVS